MHQDGSGVRVSAEVTDTGDRTGAEVAQLYVTDPSSAGEPPRELRGFEKVTLRPGQSEEVDFTVPASSLAYWNTATNGWTVAPGTYQAYVGDSSALANLPLHGGFQLAAH